MKTHWWQPYASFLGKYETLTDQDFDRIRDGIERMRGDLEVEPTASVVVIAYNEQQRLASCLMSISEMQVPWPLEVVVVDNNSHDATGEIIRRSGVVGVTELRQGVGFARNAGMTVAGGRYILSCDADTLYPVGYARCMVGILERHGDVSAVFAPYWFVSDGRKSQRSLDIYSYFRDWALSLRSVRRAELAAGGAAMAFRREDGIEIGWRNDIRRGEDGAMILALKKRGRVKMIRRSDCRVRSTSRTLDQDGNMMQMVWKRVAREMRRLGAYFTHKEVYEDKNYNKL